MQQAFENQISNQTQDMEVFKNTLERKSVSGFGNSFEKLNQSQQENAIQSAASEHRENAPTAATPEYVQGKASHAEAIVLALTPEEDDSIMENLLGLMHEVGLISTLNAIESTQSSHIKDDFHRFLVQYIKAGNDVGLKETAPIYQGLHMTLFEVSLPSNQGENEKNITELLASMEQFYAGMLSVSESGNRKYFSIEIAYPQGRNQIVFFCAIPDEKKNIFKNQVLAIFPKAAIKENTNDYNIFSKQENIAISSLILEKSEFLPIKTYKDLNYDPLNIILQSFANLETQEGAAIQIVLSPGDESFNRSLVNGIDKINRGEKLSGVLKSGGETVTQKFIGAVDGLIFGENSKEKEEDPKDAEHRSIAGEQMREKNSSRIYKTNIRLVASGNNPTHADAILGELESSFYQFENTSGNRFKFLRPRNQKEFNKKIKNYTYRIFDDKVYSHLNTTELTTLFHFPEQTINVGDIVSSSSFASAGVPSKLTGVGQGMGSKSIDNISPQHTPASVVPQQYHLPQDPIQKQNGGLANMGDQSFSNSTKILLGINSHQGSETPIYFEPLDRMRHMYVIGQTGTGKTTLLKNMIVQDIQNGDGCCFIDPHGSDIEDILAQIPEHRHEDVIYFDPTNYDVPMGLNMLEFDQSHPEQKAFVIDELFSIFKKLYSDTPEAMGPAFEQYFRNATALVLEDPASGSTMMEITRVLADEDYRKLKLSRCGNVIVKQFWEKIATQAGGDASLANIVPYITNKFDVFLSNDYLRPIIGQQKSSFNFRDIMDSKKILLVNLSKGKLGDLNANLIGLILVGKILMAALSRVDSLGTDMPPFYLYIDEFQNVTTDSISQILSEARKYKLSLNIAHQFIKQIDPKISDAVFGNVGSMAIFRVGQEDAEFLEKQLAPTFTAKDISGIDNYNAYLKLLVDGQPQKPFNISTVIPEDGNPEVREYLKNLSSQKYGRPRAEVENEIMAKFQLMN